MPRNEIFGRLILASEEQSPLKLPLLSLFNSGPLDLYHYDWLSWLLLYHWRAQYSTVQQSIVLLFTCTIHKYSTVQCSKVLFSFCHEQNRTEGKKWSDPGGESRITVKVPKELKSPNWTCYSSNSSREIHLNCCYQPNIIDSITGYTVLSRWIYYNVVSCYATLCYIMLHCFTLCHTWLHYAKECYIMRHCFTLCYIVLHRATLCSCERMQYNSWQHHGLPDLSCWQWWPLFVSFSLCACTVVLQLSSQFAVPKRLESSHSSSSAISIAAAVAAEVNVSMTITKRRRKWW